MDHRFCSFCGEAPPEVAMLVAGPGYVAICERCAALCVSCIEATGIVLPSVQEGENVQVGGWTGGQGHSPI